MSIFKSSAFFAAGTMFSRFSGLLRDIIINTFFGASVFTDAFNLAFRIPNLFREMLADGALGSAFTKVYSSVAHDDRARAQRLLGEAVTFFFVSSLVVCGLGILLSPEFVRLMTLMGKGEASPKLVAQTIPLTRIMWPYLGMTVLGAILTGVLHERGKFFISAVAPAGFNLGNIAGALLLAPLFAYWARTGAWDFTADPAITGLAVGVLVGGMLHLSWQMWGVGRSLREGLGASFGKAPWSADLKNVLALMLPATIAASTGPINVMVNTNFATSAGEGAITWLNNAFRILQLPVGIFGVAVGSAMLPSLTKAVKQAGDVMDEKASGLLQSAIENVLWLMVPCMVFMMVNATPLIRFLFQQRRFTDADAVATGAALFAYSLGVVGYGLIKVLSSFYYAVDRTSYAMRISIVSISINFISNWLLVERIGFKGLAYTSSLTLSLNCLFLVVGLRRNKIAFKRIELLKTLGLLLTAFLVSYAAQWAWREGISGWKITGTFGIKYQSALILAVNGLLTAAFFGAAACLRFRMTPRQLIQKARHARKRKA